MGIGGGVAGTLGGGSKATGIGGGVAGAFASGSGATGA
jgi:hypothetical protein